MAKKFEIVYGIQTGKFVDEVGSYSETVKKLNALLSAMVYPGIVDYRIIEIRKEVKE